MPKDASAIFHSQAGGYGELERLSALETLKGLKYPERVSLRDLVRFLDSRGLWSQFAKITLGDLREAFSPPPEPAAAPKKKKKKQRILEDELGDAYAEKDEKAAKAKAEPSDGGIETEEFARLVMPFVEGNGDVTLEDIAEYCRIERKAIRHHLSALVKEGRLERIGVGRHAVYSSAL
jgi:hypothetical protein